MKIMQRRKIYDVDSAVERLESILLTEEKIEKKKEHCKELLDRAASLTSGLAAEGKSSRSIEAKHSKLINEAIDLERSIRADCLAAMIEKTKILNEIYSLRSGTLSLLLFKRYVEGKQLEPISVEMRYSYDHIRHLHRKAIQAYVEKLNTQ